MLICVTNRKLCKDDFLQQIEQIAMAGVDAIILREKDLNEAEYRTLTEQSKSICDAYHVPLILNTFVETALDLTLPVQMSLDALLALPTKAREKLSALPFGVSVHSVEDAVVAAKNGASWLIAGHIFPTACKPDLPPRGLVFLQGACESVQIPVYAIGGITADKRAQVSQAGAAGCCMMSQFMESTNPRTEISKWKLD